MMTVAEATTGLPLTDRRPNCYHLRLYFLLPLLHMLLPPLLRVLLPPLHHNPL